MMLQVEQRVWINWTALKIDMFNLPGMKVQIKIFQEYCVLMFFFLQLDILAVQTWTPFHQKDKQFLLVLFLSPLQY